MISTLKLNQNSRLLIIVPHPDDETLATGGLIQMALAAGAQLRVIMATDGDDNPWPQRWVEKRWRIDALARARWGARRRSEASNALDRLGVAVQDVRFFGWPDQGITTLLMRDSAATQQLAAEVLDFAPNLIVAPSMQDQHPDHNAMGIMLELAVAGTQFDSCSRLDFVVHGKQAAGDLVVVPFEKKQSEVKLHALRAHASQLVLSEKRMTRLGQRPERFAWIETPADCDDASNTLEWQMPLPPKGSAFHRHAVYLIVETQGQTNRVRVAMPRLHSSTNVATTNGDARAVKATVLADANGLRVELDSAGPILRAFAKLERLGSRVLIYDHHGWIAVRKIV